MKVRRDGRLAQLVDDRGLLVTPHAPPEQAEVGGPHAELTDRRRASASGSRSVLVINGSPMDVASGAMPRLICSLTRR
jgi:hypothetical protein